MSEPPSSNGPILTRLDPARGNDLEKALAPTAPELSPFRLLRQIGEGLQPALTQPLGVAIDRSQRILVLDRPSPDRFRLSRFRAEGEAEGACAEFARAAADTDLLDPVGLIVDQDNALFIPDALAGCVKKFTPDGRWLETYRTPGPVGAPFNGPRDIDIDGQGNLYIADTNNNRIIKLLPDGELGWIIDRFATTPGEQPNDELYEPGAVCVGQGGIVAVADTNQNRILTFDSQCRLSAVLQGEDLFDFPANLRFGRDGRTLYVADRGNRRVQRFNDQGVGTGLFVLASERASPNDATGGGDMDIDADGHVVMVDPLRERVVVLEFREP
jgi:sugar lactone lactonase YvrE